MAPISNLRVNASAHSMIVNDILQNSSSAIPQPIVIIGIDGAGKTCLLQQIADSVARSGKHILWIDGRTVFSTDDIIAHQNITPHTVILIDDIDFYFTRCSYDEQYRLRHYLYNEGAPMLIATAEKVLPAFSEYQAPFFEGIKMVYLKPLAIDKCVANCFDPSNISRVQSLFDLLPKTIKSLEIIDAIIATNNDSARDLQCLFTFFSSQFHAQYKALPTYSQRILNALGTNSHGLLLSEIRKKSGLGTNILSAYLKIMFDSGVIAKDSSQKRRSTYAIKDPLFALWIGS